MSEYFICTTIVLVWLSITFRKSAAQTFMPQQLRANMSRKQVQVICWCQALDWRPADSKTSRDYTMPPAAFEMRLKMLAESGYHTTLPDQLYNYLARGTPLASGPFLLTFDNTGPDQFTVPRPELEKYGFKGVNRAQVKPLSDEDNVIGSHAWNHHNFNKYQGKDWEIRLDQPTKTLEEITGKKMTSFAYPYGLWNAQGLPELHNRGFKLAFQSGGKHDPQDPLMTVRRIPDNRYRSDKAFSNSIKHSF